MYGDACATVSTCGQKTTLWVDSFYLITSRHRTWAPGFHGHCFYPLSHLTGPDLSVQFTKGTKHGNILLTILR